METKNALWMILVALPSALGMSPLPLRTLELSELGQALESAASLAVASQRVVLEEIGQELSAAATAADRCNIFGRQDSCVEMVSDSTPFSRLCGSESGKRTDCAFRDEAFGAVQRDPLEQIYKEGTSSCSECKNAMNDLWCGLTLPVCGTFEAVVDELLPVVASVATKKSSPLDALQLAVPRIFQAAALGLPCRKMCEAMTSTCECGRSRTFGEIVISLEKTPKRSSFNMTISPSSAKELFIGLWHKPVCHLFSDENTPGFRGICKNSIASIKCESCADRIQPGGLFHEQIVVQLSQMFYGIMEGGLHPVLNAAAGGKGLKVLPENWSESLSRSESKSSQARHTGVVLLLFLLLVLAVGAFFAAVKSHRHRQVPSQYIDLHSLGYTPPML